MSSQNKDTKGFITMIVMMVFILVVIIGFAYMRVKGASK
jgi:NADH:ubiquinone oxidoreductase subunit 3 (subunit A)